MEAELSNRSERPSQLAQESAGQRAVASPSGKWLRRLAPVLILALGVAGTVALIKIRRPPKRHQRAKAAHLVEVLTVQPERRRVQVTSHGVIQPRREVAIVPEVSGKVARLNKSLIVGGRIRKRAVLLTIDPADYKLALEKARSQVAQAERNLAMAESSARVARSEWSRVGKRSGAKPSPLTLHEPQLKEARALLAATRADLEMAQLNLKRTVLRAPFNLRVRQENVEVGQYVRIGQDLARVYGTDAVEVVVPLPVAELRWLRIPRNEREEGSTVTVRLKTGSGVFERRGKLVRTVGEVDPTGRMSKVVVAIRDPYNEQREQDAEYQPDFEIGAFVEVRLAGRELDHVIVIPSETLRRGATVWVAGADDRLEVRDVVTARVDGEEALVLRGLASGDRVVLSNLAGAVDGMKLRVRSTEKRRLPREEARSR